MYLCRTHNYLDLFLWLHVVGQTDNLLWVLRKITLSTLYCKYNHLAKSARFMQRFYIQYTDIRIFCRVMDLHLHLS